MKNIKDLRKNLTTVFTDVKSKRMDLGRAKTLVATGNAILKTVQTELNHKKFTGDKTPIDFMS